MKTLSIQAISILIIGLTTSLAVGQGGLTPSGAPSPTMKTLEQVEPRIDAIILAGDALSEIVISEPGSYYLSGNLEVAKNTGIYIEADNVVLDLNGFEVSRSSARSGTGILVDALAPNATIRNGSLSRFNTGIHIMSAKCHLENLGVHDCATSGMDLDAGALVSNCRVYGSGAGIHAGAGSALKNCVANNNTGTGFDVGNGSTLNGCVAYENQGSGIAVGSGTSLFNCTARENTGTYGIYSASESTLKNCTSSQNNGTGTSTYGIYAGTGSTVAGCTSYGNKNTALSGAATQGVGIFVYGSGSIRNCTAAYNEGDGIRVHQDCNVSENSCDNNGFGGVEGAGIRVTSNDNRIDNNNVTDNDIGIEVAANGNIILRNTASGNTVDYTIVMGNHYGAVTASPGAGFTTSNPWANFRF